MRRLHGLGCELRLVMVVSPRPVATLGRDLKRIQRCALASPAGIAPQSKLQRVVIGLDATLTQTVLWRPRVLAAGVR